MTRWQRFRQWRRARPFWAGVFLIGSGVVILAPPFAALRLEDLVISLSTLGGAASLISSRTTHDQPLTGTSQVRG